MQECQHILTFHEPRQAIIQLNRPEKMNAPIHDFVARDSPSRDHVSAHAW